MLGIGYLWIPPFALGWGIGLLRLFTPESLPRMLGRDSKHIVNARRLRTALFTAAIGTMVASIIARHLESKAAGWLEALYHATLGIACTWQWYVQLRTTPTQWPPTSVKA
jgi:hypothetical protein